MTGMLTRLSTEHSSLLQRFADSKSEAVLKMGLHFLFRNILEDCSSNRHGRPLSTMWHSIRRITLTAKNS